jgi:hypothetical protein
MVALLFSGVCAPFGSMTVTVASAPAGRDSIVTVSEVGDVTETVAAPDFVASSVDVAVMVAVPEEDGVKTPPMTAPMLVGLTDQATELL